MKLLIVKRDKIGDLLLTTPFIAHLRAALPDAEIHVLANDYNAWVVADNPQVDRLWVYRRTRHAGRVRVGAAIEQVRQLYALRAERYDVAIAAGGDESPRAVRRALAVRAARTIAYVDDARRYRGLTDPLPVPKHGHEARRLMDLAVPLGIGAPANLPEPTFRVPVQWRAAAARWLAEVGFGTRRYVVIGLSARLPAMRPSKAQVLRWARRLHDERGLATALQSTPGGDDNKLYPGSEALARDILAGAPRFVRAMPDGLPAAVGIVDQARTSVMPDGGLMHFAALSPGGVVAVWADAALGSNSARWGPLGPRAAMVNAPHAIDEIDDGVLFAALAPRLAD
jgi:ADP-heptose:LPS heptosyltransferase